jgi:trigger factor
LEADETQAQTKAEYSCEIEEGGPCTKVLNIEVSPSKVKETTEQAYQRLSKVAVLPGFRKGKIPRSLFEKRFKDDLQSEVLRKLIPDVLTQAIQDRNLSPVVEPSVEDVDMEFGEKLSFKASIEVHPKITPDGYRSLKVTKEIHKVKDSDVDTVVEDLRESNAVLADAGSEAKHGLYVVIDYWPAGKEAEKVQGATALLDEGELPEPFVRAIEGKKVGDEFTVEYAPPDKREEKTDLKVILRAVKSKKLPDLDDEFAKGLGDFNSLSELRERIKSDLIDHESGNARERLMQSIISKLLSINQFEIPPSMVNDRLERTISEVEKQSRATGRPFEKDKAKEAYKPVVERQIKTALLLGAIASKEGIEVAPDEVEARMREIAEREGKPYEEFEKAVSGTDLVRRIEDDLWVGKVYDYLESVADVDAVFVDKPAEPEGQTQGSP